MEKLVWTENGRTFGVRDARGVFGFVKKSELSKSEAREATKQFEFRQQPTLAFDPETEMFYWDDDRDDQYDADEVADDLAKIGWRPEHIQPLLELARSAARLERM
ncbi:hypothetical protein [Lacipirellula parvula]|uniref:Uncharacterized protein n=1 Tax=Lacipirellula parvula TaxID=2650471 RepID=A0A5K7X4T0_9BACT|nr:hypothetical protein [Lacipirellula parvula]BBO31550.1 hypothetical protein PLANPX_1162 [Lacipirellula parvula]